VVTLLPHRAALWRGDTLLVADLHLGKSETFHAAGVPVPAGLHSETLARLGGAIRAAAPRRVLILGDLLHAPAGTTPALLASVAAWREEFPLPMQLVVGNHDRRSREATKAWNIEVLGERHLEHRTLFTHEPQNPGDEADYAWCGHLHPAVTLHGGRLPTKLACFHLSPRVGVLPAFARMAAGTVYARDPGDRVFAVAPGRVIEV